MDSLIEKVRINLNNARGLPMLYLKERQPNGQMRITFSCIQDLNVGDEIESGYTVFHINHISESRPAKGVWQEGEAPIFHDTLCSAALTKQKNELTQAIEYVPIKQ